MREGQQAGLGASPATLHTGHCFVHGYGIAFRTHGGSLGAVVARAAWKGARAHLLALPQSTPPLHQLGAIQRLRVGKGYYQAAGGGDAHGAAK